MRAYGHSPIIRMKNKIVCIHPAILILDVVHIRTLYSIITLSASGSGKGRLVKIFVDEDLAGGLTVARPFDYVV